ncbi:tetratricopeptide repeat protein [uncultured Psychroserpens sp.]|uniref:tetratricopeptide repeat protein n=1 Tax=uncultured Psychroserpens sp. TaxID=255436 RepID=UPI00261B6871|nr:tetratricopeptide repeat protein [uncultured Psychroserpens sp.]
MKVKALLFFIVLFSITVHGQTHTLDSLQQRLLDVDNDLESVKLLNTISNAYKYSDPNKMAEYGNRALELSKRSSNSIGEANAYLNIGTSNIILGNYKQSLDDFSIAKTIFEGQQGSDAQNNDVAEGLAQAYGSMGIVFSEQSNYPRALEFYLKSVKLYERLKNDVKCSRLYNNIGVVYKSQSLYAKALEYFEKSKNLQERLNDPNIGITLTNIANIYQDQANPNKAFEYYTLAKQSLDNNPNPRALGEWYNNIGLYYESQNEDSKTIESWENAITTFKQFDDKFGLSDTYLFLGKFYYERNDLDKALHMTQIALGLSEDIGVLEAKSTTEKLLSDIYEKKGNTTLALEHFQKYSVARDSLINEANIRKSVEASMKYEFEKKELLQKEENEKREIRLKEEAKSSKMKLIFGALTALLLFGIGFLIYNRSQLKKRLTLQKELAEYEQKALHLQMNPHFVFNCLGSISSFIVQNGTDSAIKYLSKFSKLMRLTLEYSKESLIPIDREIESLQNYLELEQLRFNHMFDFSIHKSEHIDDDVSMPPLLIQPFVENAIIHGVIPKKEMGNIAVKFSLGDDILICTIVDDGIGIHTSKKNKENSVVAHKSMALDIIKKRLEMMTSSTAQVATIHIDEIRNDDIVKGTKVELRLPLQYIETRTTISM